MSTSKSMTGDRTPSIRVAYLLEQLKASRSPTLGDYLIVFFLAVCVAGVAWFEGTQFFTVCMLLTFVLTLQGITEARVKRHMDLLLDLMRELQKEESG
jgi:hypothetical protein